MTPRLQLLNSGRDIYNTKAYVRVYRLYINISCFLSLSTRLCIRLIMEESNPELEQFRQQWRAEVSARSNADGHKASKASKSSRRPPPITSLSSSNKPKTQKEDDDEVESQTFGLDGPGQGGEDGESSQEVPKEPQSALEHYEKAVERENQGSLGDSLDLYRKAFRVCPSKHCIILLD